ncbi:MAG: AAA family ATPase, partial [Candidatus Micrarchaeota archaeon]
MDANLRSEIEFLNDRFSWDTSGQKRDAFSSLDADLKSGMMVLVAGLRRTGKTYLVQQVLSKTEKPFYFSFDKLAFQKPAVLEEVIRYALSQGFGAIALDEVQKVPQWSGILKGYYDHAKPRPRFLLSGSSSIQLKKGTESLAGRVLEQTLQPLSDSEYLRFAGVDAKFRKD